MSRNPKNKANTSVLTRLGPADYVTLAAATKPTPQADEGGAVLEHSDTGDRFHWTSTEWIITHVKGVAIARSFNTDVAHILDDDKVILVDPKYRDYSPSTNRHIQYACGHLNYEYVLALPEQQDFLEHWRNL